MNTLFRVHACWLIVGLTLGFFMDWSTAWSFSAGVALMLLNLVFFSWAFSGSLQNQGQKLIAIKTPIVVLKYAIWAALIYWIIYETNVRDGFFVLGLCSWVVSLIAYVVLLKLRENKGN